MTVWRATYVGPIAALAEKTVLVLDEDETMIFVQFDDLALGGLAFGRHGFPREEFTTPCAGPSLIDEIASF